MKERRSFQGCGWGKHDLFGLPGLFLFSLDKGTEI